MVSRSRTHHESSSFEVTLRVMSMRLPRNKDHATERSHGAKPLNTPVSGTRPTKRLTDGSPPFFKADVRDVWIRPGVHNAKGEFWEIVVYAPDGTYTKGLFTSLKTFAPADRRRRRAMLRDFPLVE
jgi:hypothetical protein